MPLAVGGNQRGNQSYVSIERTGGCLLLLTAGHGLGPPPHHALWPHPLTLPQHHPLPPCGISLPGRS